MNNWQNYSYCYNSLRLRETHNPLQLPVFFFLLFFFFFFFFFLALSRMSGNSEQKSILQTIKQLIQYTDLEIHIRSLKCTAVIRISKNLSNSPFLLKRYKAITMCWCKHPTSNSFKTCSYCIYLLKLYDKSIIILLTNDLISISSEISKIRLILWTVYTCNMKRLEEYLKILVTYLKDPSEETIFGGNIT